MIAVKRAGKTASINSMMNYLWEVEYDGKFRYKLIMENKDMNQAKSQAKEVIAYYLNPPKLDHTVTLVDTPGYPPKHVMNKIKQFIDKRVQSIDAVCFVIKVPQSRLDAGGRDMFKKVLELFGKDVGKNIFLLLTFADGNVPPILAAIKQASIPYKKAFKVNNAGFSPNEWDYYNDDGLDDDGFGRAYWDMGIRTFDKFFTELDAVPRNSLRLTRQVLSRR